MRRWSVLNLLNLLLLVACGSPQADEPAAGPRVLQHMGQTEEPDFSDFAVQARTSTNRLQMQLKQELTGAMSGEGPTSALGICSQRATELTTQVSSESDLEVRRVSLRHRNPENRASAGEASILALMASRPDLADTMIVRDGSPMYMRAIRINTPLCLQCHGMKEDLTPGVSGELARLYPGDTATGFSEGDLRGAFVVRPLPQ
jgi:hypothetical protein